MSRFSIIPARAVYDSRLSPHALKVLCALGVHSDKSGWCYPSLKKIGALIGCSRQTVSGHISILVRLGYIESRIQKRDDGGQSSNLYRILMDVGDPETMSDLTGGDGLEPTGGAGPEPTGGDGQLFDTITSHTNDPINDPYRNMPLSGANIEKVNSFQEKDCAKNAHTDPPSAKKKPSATNHEFDAFWQAYPRRIAKGAAIKAFNSAMKVATFSEIMDGVRRYAQSRPDPQFTPHPATWLNQQRWADEIKEEPDGKAINRGNAAPTKTDRLNAVIADAIANPPDLSVWGRPRAAYQHDRPMLSGPQHVRERAGADGGNDQDISSGAGGLPH